MATITNNGVVIASSGDVLLKTEDRKLLVSSEVLTSSSKHFGALLGPNFKEGQTIRSAQRPQSILLEEDNAQAMDDMCHLLHGHQPNELLSKVPIERLLRYAEVVDKYGCAEKLRLQSRALLSNFLDATQHEVDEGDKWSTQLVAVAYLVQDKRSFVAATHRLTMQSLKCFGTWPLDVSKDILPQRLLVEVSRRRDAATMLLIFELAPHLCDISGVDCVYDCEVDGRENIDSIFNGTWPGTRFPVQTTIRKAKKAGRLGTCTHRDGAEEVERLDAIDRVCDKASEKCAGLCLVCLRAGRELMTECIFGNHGC